MKITNFTRVDNNITADLEDGKQVLLDWAFIISNKPQIGDDYPFEPEVQTVEQPVPQEPVAQPTVDSAPAEPASTDTTTA
jgi:hypothetical protein